MLIYVSTADVDSLCAFRVLKLMLRSDNVAYSVFPVSGYGELQRLGGEIPDDGQQRAIVLKLFAVSCRISLHTLTLAWVAFLCLVRGFCFLVRLFLVHMFVSWGGSSSTGY